MIVVCAGMYRSGSTWLYNVLRRVMTVNFGADFKAGWASNKEETLELLSHPHCLVKTHQYDDILRQQADLVYTSYRDLRDVVISMNKAFHTEIGVQTARESADFHWLWKRYSCHDMRFEDMMRDRRFACVNIIGALRGVHPWTEGIEPDKIVSEVAALTHDSPGALLHKNHVSESHDPWRLSVAPALARRIERKMSPWLRERGYPLYYEKEYEVDVVMEIDEMKRKFGEKAYELNVDTPGGWPIQQRHWISPNDNPRSPLLG